MEYLCPPSADYTTQPVYEGNIKGDSLRGQTCAASLLFVEECVVLGKTAIQTHHILITRLKKQQL